MPNLNYLQEHLGPIVSNLIDLGGSLLRWRSIWTKDLDISGTGTISTAPSAGTDIVNKTYADALASSSTVEEVDGSPSYSGITTFRFDQADGFVVTNPGAGIARIDMTTSAGISEVREVDLTPVVTAVTKLEFDQADGFVVTEPVAGTARVDITAIPDANLVAIAATKVIGTFDQLGASLTGSLAVVDGGTGVSTLTDTAVLLGNGTAAITSMAALTKGQLIVGQTTADPVALAISTDGMVLTLDSAQAAGVKWAATASGSNPIMNQVFGG